ncbi:hypothetical protein Tsubulata_009869 [Turnera subulata]|uniref:TF-B3 domain-containing protein n=1 Tax=Turnera subulata TaxID=218843 RepID=A0A9Q0G511_9ROSI|nr:hypothetical protein Tsubulata_009869 [Turnera subulata]
MARLPNQNPSFFKVLLGNFADRLRIPDTFVKRFGRRLLSQRTVVLKSNAGKSSMISVKTSNKGTFFKRGWKRFAKNHDLQMFDFLVFSFVGGRTVEVKIFGPSACEKVPAKTRKSRITKRSVAVASRQARKPAASRRTTTDEVPNQVRDIEAFIEGSNADHEEADDEESERERVVEAIQAITPKHPHFVHVCKDYEKYNMIMPKSFAKATGLAAKRVTVIEDPEGRLFTVSVTVVDRGNQIHFSTGFRDFREANEIVAGDTIVFHFRETRNVIEAQIHHQNKGGSSDKSGGPVAEVAVKTEPVVIDEA